MPIVVHKDTGSIETQGILFLWMSYSNVRARPFVDLGILRELDLCVFTTGVRFDVGLQSGDDFPGHPVEANVNKTHFTLPPRSLAIRRD